MVSSGAVSTDRTNGWRRGKNVVQRCAEAIAGECELALGNGERPPLIPLGRHLETYQIRAKYVGRIQSETFFLPLPVLAQLERWAHRRGRIPFDDPACDRRDVISLA